MAFGPGLLATGYSPTEKIKRIMQLSVSAHFANLLCLACLRFVH